MATRTPTHHRPTQPAHDEAALVRLFQNQSVDGWTVDELETLDAAIRRAPDPDKYFGALAYAISHPTPGSFDEAGDRFFTALAMYKDTHGGDRDGALTLNELYGHLREEIVGFMRALRDPSAAGDRMRAFKMVQKLRMLERVIQQRGRLGRGYFQPYQPRALAEPDDSRPWNKANTIDSAREFKDRVLAASYSRPVLVKMGKRTCVHCKLMEALDTVRAFDLANPDVDVRKVWMDDNAETAALASEYEVHGSPHFILFWQGEPVHSAYGFPDETKESLAPFFAALERTRAESN